MLPTASLVMGKKKLARSCETWRDWIGTTMLFLPVVKKPQATQVAHGLPISRASELRLVEDRFFELGIGNLAIGHRSVDAAPGEEDSDQDSFCESHARLLSEVHVR